MRSKWLRGFLMAGIAACMLLVVALAGTFSVTLPTALPVSVDADGNVTTAEPIIKNTGGMTVTVAAATVEPLDGWEIVPWETDFGKLPVSSKKFAMQFYGSEVPAEGVIKLPSQSTIPVGGSAAVVYDARIAVQAAAAEDLTIANCCIVVDSDEPEVPTGAVMAANSSWYKSSTPKASITEIELVDSYTPTGAEAESWDASAAGDGSVMAYLNGTKLTLAGNGTGKIYANPDASWAFSDAAAMEADEPDFYSAVASITGLELLDTSAATSAFGMFAGCGYVAGTPLTLNSLTNWNTSRMVSMSYMFALSGVPSLDLSGWDTRATKDMSFMLGMCEQLISIDFSGFDTSAVETMEMMFYYSPIKELTLGAKFAFVGEDHGLGVTEAGVVWRDATTDITYTTAELSALTRTGKVTYVAETIKALAHQDTWYKGSTAKSVVTGIELLDAYTPTGEETESWDASEDSDGSVMAYISGTKLILAGNGSGKIIANPYSSRAFSSFTTVSSIQGLEILDTSAVTDMGSLFYGCSSLTSLDLSSFVISANTDMTSMFQNCSALTEIKGIEKLNTSAVTHMSSLFLNCSSLTSLDLSNWDTSVTTDMSSLFGGCKSLTSLNLSGWDTSATTDMSWMFSSCSALTEIKGIEKLNTSAVTNMGYLFNGCSSLTTIDLSGWDTSATTNMSRLFGSCSALTEIKGIEKLNTSAVTNMSRLFEGCSSLKSLDLSGWDTSATTDMSGMFNGTSINRITLGAKFVFVGVNSRLGNDSTIWCEEGSDNTYSSTELYAVIRESTVSYYAAPVLAYRDSWYKGNTDKSTITEIEIVDSYTPTGEETESWDASEGSEGSVMAYVSRTKLTLAGNGNKKIYAHMYFSNAFSGFSALIEIKGIERLDTSAVTDMSSLFAECRSLTRLDLSSWDTSSVTNMSYLFQDCYSLTALNLSGWDTSTTNNMSYLFYCCSALTEIYGIEQFSTSAVTNMSNLFRECKSLTSLDLSSWDTSATTDMEWMLPTVGYYSSSHGFIYCSTLDKITLGKDFHFLTEDAPMGTDDENKTRWRQEGTGFVYTTEELYDLDRSGNTTYINGSLVLKSGADWYKGNTAKSVITEIELVGSYTPTGAEAESWDASAAGDGSVMAYLNGTKLTLASVGCERIYADAYSGAAFRGFTSMVSIQGLKILNTSAVVYMWSLFDGCKSLTSLDLSSWDTSSVTSMSSLFSGCSALTEIKGIEQLNTSAVTSMYNLFSDCSSLTSLDLSSWDTSAVTNMCDLFYRCWSLTSLDLSSWNTSAATNMNRAFCVCPKLKHITLGSKFVFVLENDPMLGSEDAENPEFSDLWQDGNTGILYSASELYKLTRTKTTTYYRKPASILGSTWYNGSTSDLSAITEIEFKDSYTPTGTETESWDASASNNGTVTAYISGTKLTLAGNGRGKIYCPYLTRYGFSDYTSLVSMRGLEILDTSAVTDMSYFFKGCSALTEIKGIEQLNTSAVTDMSCLFLGCKSLTSLDLSGWDTSAATNISGLFHGCSALTEIKGIEKLNTSAVTNMSQLFSDCSSLTSLDLSGWDTSAATNMSSLFQNCSALTEIRGIEKLNTSSVTNMSGLFEWCKSLTSLDLSSWNTSAATNMSKLFYMCSSLTSLDLSSWDTSAATDMGSLFQNCSALTEIRGIEKLNTSSVTNMSGLFEWCESLTTIDLSGWDTSAATYMVAMFSNCSVLTEIKGIERLNTSAVTNMTSLFAYCSSLTSLDLSGWDTSAVRYMGGTNGDYNGMFLGSRNLRTIYVSEKWSTASVEASGGMFDGCTNLQGAIAYDSTKIDATYANYETGYLTYKAAPGTVQSVMAAAAPDGAEQVITPAGEEPENGSSAGADTEIEPTPEETLEDAAPADDLDEKAAEPPDEGGSATEVIIMLALPAVWKGVLYGKTK